MNAPWIQDPRPLTWAELTISWRPTQLLGALGVLGGLVVGWEHHGGMGIGRQA